MSEENDTGKHEFNFFLDKQIQQKLLEADELIAAKETALYRSLSANFKVQLPTSTSNNNASNSNSSNVVATLKNNPSKLLKEKDISRANISGWCAGPGIVYRKTESEVPVRTRGQQGFRDTFSRDSKFRPQTHNLQDFVFRHYADPRRYIEQYRKEHTCYDTTTTSAARSEFLETRRFYAYNQYSPLAVGTQNNAPSVNSPLPSSYQETAVVTSDQTLYNQKKQQQAPILQYTNRREQTKQTISASLRPTNIFKLSKSNTTHMEKAKTPDSFQETSALLDREGQIKRAGSARGSASPGVNGISLQRNSTAAASEMDRLSSKGPRSPSAGMHSEPNIQGQFLGRKLGQVIGASGQTRTLDSLACQAVENGGGKQISGVTATVGSRAADTSYPEVRLEQLRRVNRHLLVAPAAPSIPQLTFIREGEEGAGPAPLADDDRSARRAGMGRNSRPRKAGLEELSESGMIMVEGSSSRSVDAYSYSDSGGDGGWGDGVSVTSSLHPNGGSSVRTSIGSFTESNSSSNNQKPVRNNNNNYDTINNNNHKPTNIGGYEPITYKPIVNITRANSAERFESSKAADKDALYQRNHSHSQAPPTSTASLSSVPSHLSNDQSPPLSWRDRVRHQQQQQQQLQHKTMTSSGDAPGEKEASHISRRWALVRQQEELSSVTHARRIRHLIEESRQRGGAGLKLERSASEDSTRGVVGREEGEATQGLGALRVEGQRHRYRRHARIPPATTTSGGGRKGRKSIGEEERFQNSVTRLSMSQPVLPPVGKTRGGGEVDDTAAGSSVGGSVDTQTKPRSHDAQTAPVLGDLLDAQSFFSHGVPVGATTTSNTSKHQHPHSNSITQQQQSMTPPEKQRPSMYEAPLRVSPALNANYNSSIATNSKTNNCNDSSGSIADSNSNSSSITATNALATVQVIGEAGQARLRYCSNLQHKLMGGCSP